jgi:ATP-binding cassette subfamily F protein 3
MDEPTNHLDMETIDALINAVAEYKGGVIVVSHDLHFLSSVATSYWAVGNGVCKVNSI